MCKIYSDLFQDEIEIENTCVCIELYKVSKK